MFIYLLYGSRVRILSNIFLLHNVSVFIDDIINDIVIEIIVYVNVCTMCS